MNIDPTSNEVQLALKEIDRAEKRGQGYYDQIGAAISALINKLVAGMIVTIFHMN